MKIDTVLVDRYQIREQLSRKAGRRTFLAQDLQTQSLVIIKILKFDEDFQWDDLKLFEREASTLQNLSHPAIPEYLDYFDVEMTEIRGFALVQTYIEAPSLESVIKDGRKFSEPEVIELVDKLLTILTYLHEQNPPVIHRDIKPSNILLTNRSGNSVGDVYLVDFGSVQTAASKDGGTITIVGSYGYMPLEQFGGQTTTASDLYSLGMTIIYLLTGNHPAELLQVNGQVKFTAEISNKFYRWIEKAIQPHLVKRFETAKSAQNSLTSEDGSYGDFLHLKPAHSKVRLCRDRDNLEIRFASLANLVRVWPINTIGFPIIMTIFHIVLSPVIGLGGLVLGLSAYFFVFLACVFVADGYLSSVTKVISIDRNSRIIRRGILSAENNKIKWGEPVLFGFDIIVYSHSYIFDRHRDNLQNEEPSIYSELSFNGQYGNYLINEAGSGLTEAELWWLGQEISDFLGMELQVIHSAPAFSQSSLG
jgi:serine/threonine protein kinase